MPSSPRARGKVLLVSIAFAALAVAAAYWTASLKVKAQLMTILGADSEAASISLGWSGVTIEDLRGKGPQGWPVEQAFRAERVVIRPELGTLFSDTLRIREIEIEKPYVSVLREKDGQTRFLPGLIRKEKRDADAGPRRSVAIDRIVVHNGDLDWFDATVDKKPVRLQLAAVEAELADLIVPLSSRQSRFTLKSAVRGEQRNGTLSLDGWVDLAKRDSSVKSRLRGADILVFQPYLIKRAETGVKRGTLDLDLDSEVRDRHLKAPGRIVITGLELAPQDGAVGTFMGLQRNTVLAFLKDSDERIDVEFTLEGKLGDTQLSLQESLPTRIGLAAAEVIGLSVRGVVKGVGTLGQESVNFVGDTLGKIFGSDDDAGQDKDTKE